MKTREDLTLSGLVHDLNNVFQTLVDAADLLSGDPRYAKLSVAILRSVERGKNIAASIQSGSGTGTPFEQILANAIAFVEDSVAAGRGPEISFSCDVESGIQLGGHWSWERVLINLFRNSMDAMPAGGTIYVLARYAAGQIEIIVRDEGLGIAPEVLNDLFLPHVSTGSSGLGLHIVETIVKQEGGCVRASNRADRRGAEFIITLPFPSRAVPARAS
ncbi:MAG TPA: HAMP domain-containing sensor histidine kinase [Bryobacteraceae bacterium]|nr:HAMP domain-containing sensor histidine kinase [Bryobacteraceae bacterium]